jgi:Acetyl/propionyl-CoA carboxylase, alpha subunit
MFKKILIANRGEIAVRVIQACRELDIISVAIFSEADQDSKHVALAGEAWKLEGQPGKVYLDAEQILSIAKRSGAEAIHPGYGFMSENPEFARACAAAGIKFIGPAPDVIHKMGSKVESRRIMSSAGVPVVPGTTDPVTDPAVVKELGTKYGYPIAIKASAGGGGRGLRVVRKEEEVENALQGAQREGATYFGNGEVYVEKYLDHPRHIEVQVIGDEHGNVIHLFERDCSSQRRHQKLVEETPAANLDPKVKSELLASAVRGTKALGYSSAGTLEFLVAGDKFYFLEMNTRVQVEHPITEATTGVDIVKEQILVATGAKLSLKQEEITQRGHAIEFRINAENPDKNFMPNPGTLTTYKEPSMAWVRVDSAAYPNYQILPFYDSLLAKLVVWGRTREEAIVRSKLALRDYKIVGAATTIPFHLAILDDPTFLSGGVYTTYVEAEFMKRWNDLKERYTPQVMTATTATEKPDPTTNGKGSLAIVRTEQRNFEVAVNQRSFKVSVAELVDPTKIPANPKTGSPSAQRPASRASGAAASASSTSGGSASSSASGATASGGSSSNGNAANKGAAGSEIRSAMHGLVKEILVNEGAKVESGQKLMIFEAMKMESEIVADKSGTITSIKVKVGQSVDNDILLLTIGE